MRPTIATALLLLAVPSFATLSRTAVSINGVDTNPCSVAAPCRSFSASLAQTSVGGEVIALTSAGYGVFSISQAVSIEAAPGVYAGITAPPSITAVVIDQSGGGMIVVRGLSIIGPPDANGAAVFIHGSGSGDVFIENCVVAGGDSPLADWATAGQIFVSDSVFRHGAHGGVQIGYSGSTHRAFFNRCRFESNSAPGDGMNIENANVVIRDSVFIRNDNAGIFVFDNAHVVIERCLSAGNAYGIAAS